MNSKKVNILFLIIVLVHFAAEILLSFLQPVYAISMVGNYILSEGIVVIPAMVMLWFSKEKIAGFLRFKKIKIGTLLMVVLFTLLTSPTISLVNLISQLFVKNTIGELSPAMLQSPMWITFFFVAVLAPLCEETVCRGVVYQGYKKDGSRLAAMLLSALIFASIHLNFNQASYAFVMGILAVLLVEVTGSIWSSVFYHLLINGQSVCILYLYQKMNPEMLMNGNLESVTGNTDMMMAAIGVYLLLAAITLPLAIGVLIWMGNHEGRGEKLRLLWEERKLNKLKKDKMITIPLLIALILCLAYMIVGALASF